MISSDIVKKAIHATEKAQTTNHCKHSAVLYTQKGKILACGYNVMIENEAAKFFHRHPFFHAETLCLWKAFGNKVRRGNQNLYLFSLRLNSSGEFRLAKPCKECMKAMQRARIRAVYYSTSKGEILRNDIHF